MENGKRFHWLKLREGFFNNKEIKIILSQKNGSEYCIFWQKLLLLSVTSIEPGLLRFNDEIPYTTEMLSTVSDTDVDVVRSALQLFEKLGMIHIRNNGDIWIDGFDFLNLIGSETDYAIRKRNYRNMLDEQKKLPMGQYPKNVRQSKSKSKSKIKKGGTMSPGTAPAPSSEDGSVPDDKEERKRVVAEAMKEHPEIFKRGN